MPIYSLSEELVFPDPHNAEPDGLLAVGGDLSIERLLLAYSHGIFPWFEDDSPLLWWALDPRMVLKLEDFKIPKSLKSKLNKAKFDIRFDHDFEQVIDQCSKSVRKGQDGTWILKEMKEAYISLHKAGFAHSVETYMDNELVGGLYGVSLGRVFCGESMFHLRTDASKIAFTFLVEKLRSWDFEMIDAQMETPLLKSFGAKNIPFADYYEHLQLALDHDTKRGSWEELMTR